MNQDQTLTPEEIAQWGAVIDQMTTQYQAQKLANDPKKRKKKPSEPMIDTPIFCYPLSIGKTRTLPRLDTKEMEELNKCADCFADQRDCVCEIEETNATYHGLIKVSCVLCEYETKDISTMEMLNDLSGTCPNCEKQFFRWENLDGSVVVSLTKDIDGLHTYDNLTDTKENN